jgi:16S rRNA (uracil1498-N3)-methyltransferase
VANEKDSPALTDSSRPPLFITDHASLGQDQVRLSGVEGRHASTVRRLRPGERADLTDGAGLLAECVVAATGPGLLELTVLRRQFDPPPQLAVCVVQALPKGDRGELAVETMTEVGVDVIVPWAAERCVASWVPGPRGQRALERWRATARAAAKQSRRSRIPEVTELAAAQAVIERAAAAASTVVLDPGAGVAIGALPLPAGGEVMLIVGPEGGLSPAERDAFAAAGAVTARLGPTVLRSSTAGAVAAAVLLSRSGRW